MSFSEIGKKRRLSRLFTNNKTLIVPVDDSLIIGPEEGLKDLDSTLMQILNSHPNAIMGFKRALQKATEIDCKVPFIYNMTASTCFQHHTNKVMITNFESMIASGVDCVAAHINFSSKFESEELKNISFISNCCDKFGIPFMAIAYARKEDSNGNDYNYDNIKDTEKYTSMISHIVRICEELGADIVKTNYTGDCESFKEVVSSVNIPVVVAGGPKIDTNEVKILIHNIINSGSAGICFGRNIFNSKAMSQQTVDK